MFPKNDSNTTQFIIPNTWFPYSVPRGAKMLLITAWGGGGAGAAGASGADTTNRQGGGAGGDGAILCRLIPCSLIPSELNVRVGAGAIFGGATATASLVTIYSQATSGPFILINAPGGSNGSLPGGGTAGGAATNLYGNLAHTGMIGNSISSNGTSGGVSTGAIGTNSTIQNGVYGMGGPATGGGSCVTTSFNGGSIISTNAWFPPLSGGIAPGGAGNDGFTFFNPFVNYGGTGGASHTSGTGGKGGNGGLGRGGGGGGAGVTGGNGGDGGNGMVLIQVIF